MCVVRRGCRSSTAGAVTESGCLRRFRPLGAAGGEFAQGMGGRLRARVHRHRQDRPAEASGQRVQREPTDGCAGTRPERVTRVLKSKALRSKGSMCVGGRERAALLSERRPRRTVDRVGDPAVRHQLRGRRVHHGVGVGLGGDVNLGDLDDRATHRRPSTHRSSRSAAGSPVAEPRRSPEPGGRARSGSRGGK